MLLVSTKMASDDEDGVEVELDSLWQVLMEAEAMPRTGTESRPSSCTFQSTTASRNAMRREARNAKRVETRLRKRSAAREQRAEVRAKRAANGVPSLEQKLQYWNTTNMRRARDDARLRVRAAMAAPWSDPEAIGVRVAIDLGMEALMSPGEIKSLIAQLTVGYGEVLRRATDRPDFAPLRLALTNLDEAPLTLGRLRNADKWGAQLCPADFGVAVPALCAGPQSKTDATPCPPIVVLSPDAEEVLHSVTRDEVYVIGGLCDYKRIANVTASRASERGVRAARLPITEAFGANDMVDILTVNQVIVALMVMANTGDWRLALREALPPRKLRVINEHLSKSDD